MTDAALTSKFDPTGSAMFSIHFAPHQHTQQPMILHVILGTNPDGDPSPFDKHNSQFL